MIIGMGILATACNAKDEDSPEDTYITTESVAVTGFSLSPNFRVMRNLDSVYFSIDLEHGVIFNADSLPKGTDVRKLVAVISYPSSVTSAVIEMTGGTYEGSINYYSNPSDSIDFTGDVKLTLGTAKNEITKTYTLKVNVHKEDPDTMYWDTMSSDRLPSQMENPIAQKTVVAGSKFFCLVEESDGSYSMAVTNDIFEGFSSPSTLNLPFKPEIESFTANNDGGLFILGDGDLWESADGRAWTVTETGWDQIIGMYGSALLGVSSGRLISYPSSAVPSMEMPEGFPVKGCSNPIEISNRWASEPTIVIFGGTDGSGRLSSSSWAFDGSQWTDIADKALPPLEGLSVVDYYSYLNSASNSLLKEFEVYLAFGGRDETGNLNNTVYVTFDHGITWQRAQKYMQLPDGMQAGYMANALSVSKTLNSNLSDRWKISPRRRLPFEIDGDVIKWECPYIFIFGGYNSDSVLNDRIRAGVLQRLTFAPLF